MIFCNHKNEEYVGKIPSEHLDVWRCKKCGKFCGFNKYLNISTGWQWWKTPPEGMEWDQRYLINLIESLTHEDIGRFSDGCHTFDSLYEQRCVLFATIVNQNSDKAWKSLRHEDGEPCFDGGWFIVGIDTPEGSYTYHYELDKWDMFHCRQLPKGKHWDGHTEKDVTRLLSLVEESTQ